MRELKIIASSKKFVYAVEQQTFITLKIPTQVFQNGFELNELCKIEINDSDFTKYILNEIPF